MKLLSKINRMFNVTILMVTHDILSASYANRVVVLKDGQFDKEILKSGCGSTYRDTISQALSKVGE